MAEPVGDPLVDPALLPDYAAWLAVNPDISLITYAHSLIQPDLFFAVASLLWPRFVRHRDCLFLEDGFSVVAFDQWFHATADLTAIERVMNHRHMRDISKSFDAASRPVLLSTATLIQQCWEARLAQLCPQNTSRVELVHSDYDVKGTFYTVRH